MENLFLKEIINWLKETIDEGYRNLTYEYDEDENELLIKSKDEELCSNKRGSFILLRIILRLDLREICYYHYSISLVRCVL